jgi:hypothetical protein
VIAGRRADGCRGESTAAGLLVLLGVRVRSVVVCARLQSDRRFRDGAVTVGPDGAALGVVVKWRGGIVSLGGRRRSGGVVRVVNKWRMALALCGYIVDKTNNGQWRATTDVVMRRRRPHGRDGPRACTRDDWVQMAAGDGSIAQLHKHDHRKGSPYGEAP